jgi:large subunit ribosomal protein L13
LPDDAAPSAAPDAEKKPARAPKVTRAAAPKDGAKPAAKPAKAAKVAGAPKVVAEKPAAAPKVLRTPPALAGATVVDASDLVLGRAASLIAKRLLQGESIVVVNAEKSVVTGNRAMVLDFYIANRARGSKRTGPHYPRYPDRIFRRTVRGMLPHLKTRGKVAFERLEVHIGVPPQYTAASTQTIDGAKARPALRPPTTLGEISKLLGARL